MKLILKYLSGCRVAALVCVAVLVFQAVFTLALPYYTGETVGVGIQQSGIDHDVPKVIGENAMELFKVILPEEEFAEMLSMYSLEEFPPEGSDAMFEDLRFCYFLNPSADKNRISEIYGNVLLCGIIVAEEMLGNYDKEIDFNSVAKYASVGTLKSAVRKAIYRDTDFSELYERASNEKTSVKTLAASMVLPYIYKDAGVDISQVEEDYLLKTAVKMLLCVALQVLCMLISAYLSSKISADVCSRLRNDIMKHTSFFTGREFKEFPPSRLSETAGLDVEQVGMIISYGLRVFIYAPILAVGGTLLAFSESMIFGSMILGCAVFITAVLAVLFFVTVGKYDKLQQGYSAYTGTLRSNFRHIFTVRSYGAEKREEKKVEKFSETVYKNEKYVLNAVFIAIGVVTLTSNIVVAAMLILGGGKLLDSSLSLGSVVAFLQYSAVTVSAYLMLGAVVLFAPRASVSAKEITKLFESKPSCKFGGVQALSGKADVEFRDVPIFGGKVNFVAREGEITVIVGATGCGKSTLLNYVTGYLTPEQGEIIIGGRNINDYNIECVRRNVAFAESVPVIFSRSLRENLILRGAAEDDGVMLESLEKACCGFVACSSQDLDKLIMNGGKNFSGGQRARIALAGVFAKQAKINLFDDCFTALDNSTVMKIFEAVKTVAKNSAVIIVSQNSQILEAADKVVYLNSAGESVSATHNELLRGNKLYREMFEFANGEVAYRE